jgi:hypothetical protein
MHDLVDLVAHLLVDLGDHRLDGLHHVAGNELGAGQGLLGECPHGALDFSLGGVGLGIELLVEQDVELGNLHGCCAGLGLCFLLGISHGTTSLVLSGFGLAILSFGRRRQRLQQSRIAQGICDQVLSPGATIHIGNQVGQLLPSLQRAG